MLNLDRLNRELASIREADDGRSHILITGEVQSGKTTTLKHYLKKYYGDVTLDGIITKKIGDKIELWRYDAAYIDGMSEHISLHTVIGDCIDGRMRFYEDVFEDRAIKILKELKSDITVMDEIGNGEKGIASYVDELIKMFNRRRVFAVLKKKGNPVFDNLDCIGDYRLIEI